MISLTPEAIQQIKSSAEQSQINLEEMALRLAAKKNPDETMEYGMGFDEPTDDDLIFKFDGVLIAVAGEYGPLLNGTTIDYVELEPGQFHFIFMNPNDANYTPAGSQGGSN